jgi:hypothetical protein
VYAILFMCYLFQAKRGTCHPQKWRPVDTGSWRWRLSETPVPVERTRLSWPGTWRTVEAADRYYDRSRQTQGRHAILDIIQHQYKVSRNLVVNS